jgi:hypothetical protein
MPSWHTAGRARPSFHLPLFVIGANGLLVQVAFTMDYSVQLGGISPRVASGSFGDTVVISARSAREYVYTPPTDSLCLYLDPSLGESNIGECVDTSACSTDSDSSAFDLLWMSFALDKPENVFAGSGGSNWAFATLAAKGLPHWRSQTETSPVEQCV